MTKNRMNTMIGLFVLAAIALAVAAILIAGSGKFFKETQDFVIFFDGSARGLDIGAPVTLRGAQIGNVKDVILMVDEQTGIVYIKVYIEVDPRKVQNVQGAELKEKMYQKWLDMGLRAQMNTTSMVTGKRFIDMDFYPDKPMKMVGLDPNYREIPSVPTSMEMLEEDIKAFLTKFEKLPLEDIVNNLNSTLENIDSLTGSPELKGSISSFNAFIDELTSTTRNLNAKLDTLETDLHDLVTAAQSTITQVDTTLDSLDDPITELVQSIKKLSESAQGTFTQAESTLKTIQTTVDERSPIYKNINEALREISLAVRSLKQLSDYLEQHPESVLRGKGK